MTDPSRRRDTGQGDDRPSAAAPRWMYALGVGVVVAVVVLVVVLHAIGVLGSGSH